MSAINFVTANPFVQTYSNQVAALGAEERAVDAAARSRADWMRAEADRQAVADAQSRQMEILKATAPPAAPAKPAVPAQPAAVVPGTQSAMPGQMAEAADMTAAVPAQPAMPAQRGSTALSMISAMGNHPAMNATRGQAISSFATSQDQRANTLEDQNRQRSNQIADRVHELAASNDPTKLAMARHLAQQNGINLPEQYWTDAGVRARVNEKLTAIKASGRNHWEYKDSLAADPDMGQTPAGRVALESSRMTAPIVGAPIQTGGAWETRPDGSSVYKPGPMYLNRGGQSLEQATDEEGNPLAGTAGGGRGIRAVSSGAAGGAGTQTALQKNVKFLIDNGLATNPDEAYRMLKTSSYNPQVRTALLRNMMKEVDPSDLTGRRLKYPTMEAANAELTKMSALGPQGASTPRTAVAPGREGDRLKILQSELAAEEARAPTDAADTERKAANIAGLQREIAAAGGSAAPARPAATPAATPPAQSGRVSPAAIKWAKDTKAKGSDARSALAELKAKGYSKDEAIQILRQGGY